MIILKSKRRHPSHTEKTIFLIKRGLKKKGVCSRVVALEDLEVFLEKNHTLLKINSWVPKINEPVFFRVAEKYKNASFILSKYLELHKIPYIDNYHSYTRERSKLIQMFLLAINNLSIPKTYYSPVYDSKKIDRAVDFLGFPVVIKLTYEDRGEGVFLAKNKKELAHLLKTHTGKETILQEFIQNDFDYRILVLGHKTALGEKRIRVSKTDFRNNVSKGAKEEFVSTNNLSKKLKTISEKASRIMNIQVCGVDAIESPNGNVYIIEVNFSPSFTLDERISNEINCLTDYLKKWNEKK